MNDPDSLHESPDEVRPDAPLEEPEILEEMVVEAGRPALEDDFEFLLNYDEDDEPRLRATGELELPSPEDGLDAYEAVMLYNFLCSQSDAPQLVFNPSNKTRPQLYDWFVSSLATCPLAEALDQLLRKLAAWKRHTRTPGGAFDEDELDEMNVDDSINWDEFPGLPA